MMAKIGDEIYMHPHQDSISFCTVTMAKSAYIEITFNSNFFSFYKLEDFADEDAQKCKISIRVRVVLSLLSCIVQSFI